MEQLSRDQFADALWRGQGRAFLHVEQHGLGEVADLVLDACLRNRTYDPRMEDSRALWLMCMFFDSEEYDRFMAEILEALESETDTWDLQQLCQLAALMAARGDDDARAALRKRVMRQAAAPVDNWVGAHELVALDGVDAVVQLARCFGEQLRQLPGSQPPLLDELLQELDLLPQARNALTQLAETDPEVRAYREYSLKHSGIDQDSMQNQGDLRCRSLHEAQPEALSLATILADAAEVRGDTPGRYAGFGMTATPEDLREVLHRLDRTDDPRVALRLLSVFRRRPFPELPLRIWEWAGHADGEVRDAAIEALAQLKDRKIGEFGREKLRSGELGEDNAALLDLFIRNFEPGDGALIMTAVNEFTPSLVDPHGFGNSLLAICREHPGSELDGALRWIYEMTPCSNCRCEAVLLLAELGTLTPDIIAECLNDASERIQEVARELQDRSEKTAQ
jgi:hypothetical protein